MTLLALMEALVHVKAANEQAVQWHQQAQQTGPSTVIDGHETDSQLSFREIGR